MAITYIDELVVVSLPQVMEHRGIVKVCQVRHILSFFVFRWVHLLELIFLEVFCLLLFVQQFIFISCRPVCQLRFIIIIFILLRSVWLGVVSSWFFFREREEKRSHRLVSF